MVGKFSGNRTNISDLNFTRLVCFHVGRFKECKCKDGIAFRMQLQKSRSPVWPVREDKTLVSGCQHADTSAVDERTILS